MNASDWKSEAIDKLAPALLAAQKAIQPAVKESKNPAFKSKYADLNNCLEAVYAAFHPNGLIVTQLPMMAPGECSGMVLRTVILHESGQWIASDLPMMPDMANPQKVGGCITYGRRYGIAAMSGLTQEDDDGETANGRGPGYDYDRQPANGHSNGNGHAPGRHGNGNGENRMPTTGKQLYAWAKAMGETYAIDVVKWLDRFGQAKNLPGKFLEWSDDEVKAAAAAALAAMNKRYAAASGPGEAAD